MLFYSTIDPETLQLLKDLQKLKIFKDFLLVGGTSLALQIGHRTSIDLNLFTSTGIDISSIPDEIEHLGKIRIINQASRILNLFINNIKVDFVSYQYDFLNPVVSKDGLRLASIPDIAAMKLAAITGRGSRKDFIELYFILQLYPLAEIFKFYRSKFPDGSEFLVYKSLTYFGDAEIEPIPKMIKPVDWNEVKRKIISEVKAVFP